eukprot:15450140-Alexandrium_andersonii.AAC.1
MKPRRTKSATPLRISWSFFSGIVTRTPSEHISKHAPIHTTEGPEVALRRARGYPAKVAQRRAIAHSLALAQTLPPA